jgi:MFS superfamily sulfate permease-like transporter
MQMFEDSDETEGKRIVFAILVGVTFGAALGTTVLQDITQGIVVGVVVGTLAALVFPERTDRLFGTITDKPRE